MFIIGRLSGKKAANKLGAEMSKRIYKGLTWQTVFQFEFSKYKVEDAIDNEKPEPCVHSYNMHIKHEPEKVPNIIPCYKIPEGQDYGITFPEKDEDKANPEAYVIAANAILNSLPITDKNIKFPEEIANNNEAFQAWEDSTVSKIYKSFEHTFVGLENYDLTSDKGASLMAFNGLGCHFTKKINYDEIKEPEDPLNKYQNELKSAKYMIDLRILGQFPVRDGFIRYGCSAYFNDKYEIIGIYACHYKKLFTPNDDDHKKWEHAKWLYRVTITTVITIKTHLLETHQIVAHSLVVPTRERLPFNHPLRRFLKPFCFRTVYINHSAAQNLIGKKQLVHRAWAFNYKEVHDIMATLNKGYEFDLHKNRFKNNGMTDVPDDVYPIKTDMTQYWNITHDLVTNYVKIFYESDQALKDDEFIPNWYKAMLDGLHIKKDSKYRELTMDNMCNIICNGIFNGSAWHQYVGNTIQEYLKRPNWCGSKIRDNNSNKADIQAYIQAITIGLLTGLPMPDIVNNWKFVLLKGDDNHYRETSELFDKWQTELMAMTKEVHERNEKRRMPIKFCDPSTLDCSVGI